MSNRKIPLITGEIYHVFNRSVAKQPIFNNKKDYQRALDTLLYYTFLKPGLRFSFFNRLALDQKLDLTKKLKKAPRIVELLAFCLMPNHLHLLLKQTSDNGISDYMRYFQNSYAKYFNTKYERSGSLFQSMFKAVRIEDDEQLIHVCRYIHLNPLTSFELKNVGELEYYPWSSYKDYTKNQLESSVTTQTVLNHFPSLESFRQFTQDQIDYQRQLSLIKHLTLE